MSEVIFYHHERADGGRRTGIEFDQSRGLEFFQETSDEDAVDPTLLWHVDVRTMSDAPIESVSEANRWLNDHVQDLLRSLELASEKWSIGIDLDEMAASFTVSIAGRDYEVEVGGQNRIVRRDLGSRLTMLAAEFNGLAAKLKPYEPMKL